MKVIQTGIPGVVVIEPVVRADDRGFFMELWKAGSYTGALFPKQFVQSNLSRSGAGVLRGLHYQFPQPQGKLVSVLEGRVFDVAVDIRPDSPTFRQWAGAELSGDNHRQLYVPEGFAHGFCVLGEGALMNYLCTEQYHAHSDAVIAWNDPDIAVKWPIRARRMSEKDRTAPLLREVALGRLPRMHQ
jgi:dTDP-4-dehydrorhamnose 3,5-epimerase